MGFSRQAIANATGNKQASPARWASLYSARLGLVIRPNTAAIAPLDGTLGHSDGLEPEVDLRAVFPAAPGLVVQHAEHKQQQREGGQTHELFLHAVLHITESQVLELFPMHAAIGQMRYAFEQIRVGAAINQPRRRLILPTGSVLHQMAGSCGDYFATKIYSSNARHGGLHEMFVLLYSAETGKPLAFIEALNLSVIRTGAATGYAADLLAHPDADVLGLIGSGLQARAQVDAIRAVRSIREVRVWSRTPENTQRFAAEMNCRPVESAEAAARGAPIVVTATNAKDPVLDASWIAPGTFVAAMGSNIANRRELPAGLVRSAGAIYVDNMEQAAIEAGDLILADHWANVLELQEASRGHDAERVTVFESLGIAVEDCAAAAYVYEQAVK